MQTRPIVGVSHKADWARGDIVDWLNAGYAIGCTAIRKRDRAQAAKAPEHAVGKVD